MLKRNNHESNLSKILAELESGKRITVLSVLLTVKTIELRHYIAIIRKTTPVNSIWIKKDNKQFKEYFL